MPSRPPQRPSSTTVSVKYMRAWRGFLLRFEFDGAVQRDGGQVHLDPLVAQLKSNALRLGLVKGAEPRRTPRALEPHRNVFHRTQQIEHRLERGPALVCRG